MSTSKKFRIPKEQIVEIANGYGGCIATDKITVEGQLVDYMIREEPFDKIDSGWRFYSGTEDQDYVDNADNAGIYDINTIANYDKAIIPYLDLPKGTELERLKGTDIFREIP